MSHQLTKKKPLVAALHRNQGRFIPLILLFCLLLGFLLLQIRPAVAAVTCQTQHLVQRGETLSRIGQRYGIGWGTLAQANNLANPDRIYAGQYICIPASSGPTTPPPAGCQVQHVVQRGEVLSRISQRFGVTTASIAQANNLANPNLIYVGQRLCIPSTSTQPPPAQTIPTFSIVSVIPGQSVTIRTANYPANQQFDVFMGAYGTKGVNGVWVTSINSGVGGSSTATYPIPAAWRGADRIAIRLQSPAGYYSYNWFYNR
jgi:LysM repeat protein